MKYSQKRSMFKPDWRPTAKTKHKKQKQKDAEGVEIRTECVEKEGAE
jgi:hypothetical protein